MSAEDLLDEPDDTPNMTTAEGLKQFLGSLSNEELQAKESGIINQVLYNVRSEFQLMEFLTIYANEKLNRNMINPTEHTAFIKEKAKQFVHPLKRLPSSSSVLSVFFPSHPIKVDLVIPTPYYFDYHRGTLRLRFDNKGFPEEEVVSPHVILPIEIVEDSSNTSGDMLLRLIIWNPESSTWEYFPEPVSKGLLVTERGIGVLDNKSIVTLGDEYRKPTAKFLTDVINSNNGLRKLPKNTAAFACGWTKDNLFFPFTTKSVGSSLIFTGKRDTAAYAIYELSRQLPRGVKAEAFHVLDELKDNPTFGIVLAGCLVSPLVPKMKGILDENIGIDVYGKTTSGKTAVETIAANLIYGLGDAIKQQWGKATPAGIWGHAEACNNLPIILDDTHQMKEKHLGIPHDLLNGKEGSKQIKIGSG